MNKKNKVLQWVETQLNILNTFGTNSFELIREFGWEYKEVKESEIKFIDNKPFYNDLPIDFNITPVDDGWVEICCWFESWDDWEVGCFCR